MGQSFYQQVQLWFKAFEARITQTEQRLGGLNHVLQEIIGKELMRGQALHKVLMDKGLFTDDELKKALEDLIAEAKADLAKAETEVKEEKQKAVELLIPAGANITPPTEPTPAVLAPEVAPAQPTQETPSAEPPASNG